MILIFMLPVIAPSYKQVFCQYAIVECKDNFDIPLYRPDFLKAFVVDVKKTVGLNEKNSVRRRRKRTLPSPIASRLRMSNENATSIADSEPNLYPSSTSPKKLKLRYIKKER
jgi:hypothetical protein